MPVAQMFLKHRFSRCRLSRRGFARGSAWRTAARAASGSPSILKRSKTRAATTLSLSILSLCKEPNLARNHMNFIECWHEPWTLQIGSKLEGRIWIIFWDNQQLVGSVVQSYHLLVWFSSLLMPHWKEEDSKIRPFKAENRKNQYPLV